MARYRIVPERSTVSIDARSNVHPIHSSTDGLEGFVDLEVGAGRAGRPGGQAGGPAVAGRSTGFRRAIASRTGSCSGGSTPGAIRRSRACWRRSSSASSDCSYRVSGRVTFRGSGARSSGRDDDPATSTTTPSTLAGQSRFDIRDFGMEPPRFLMLKVDPQVAGARSTSSPEGAPERPCTSSGLCSSIVDAVERRAGDRSVVRVRVRVGRLHHVHPRRSTSPSPWRRSAPSPRMPSPSWCCCRSGPAAPPARQNWECDELPIACDLVRIGWTGDHRRRRAGARVDRVPRDRVEGESACVLGIPGQVVELVDSNDHLARVDVAGVTRIINIGLLEDEQPAAGRLGADPRRLRHVEDRRGGGQAGPGVAAADGTGLRGRARRPLDVADEHD